MQGSAGSGERVLGVLQEVVDHLPQLRGVAAHRRQRRVEPRRYACRRVVVQHEHLAHQPVQIERAEARCRHARIVAKVVDHRLHRRDLVDDRLGRARQRLGLRRGELVRELDLQPLRGELDRRERVLDLVGQPACDLAPGGGALRGDELRHVVEDHDVSAAARQTRAAHQDRDPAALDIQLPLPRARRMLRAEALPDRLGEDLERRGASERAADAGDDLLPEDRRGTVVRDLQLERLVECKHAGREVREDVLEVRPGAFDLLAVRVRPRHARRRADRSCC